MTHYGVLLIGGNRTHQESHAGAFAADARTDIVAVADERRVDPYREELNRDLARELGVRYVRDLDEALALPGVDIISCCPDVERRGRVTTRCAETGRALYLDKPLAGSVGDAVAIADAVDRSGAVSQMYSFVNTPWAQAARRCVAEGRLGRLLAVHSDVLFAKGRGGTAVPGRPRVESGEPSEFTFVTAKREMFDLGVYSVGLCLWVSGKTALEVFATTGNYFFKEHQELGIEDFGVISVALTDGVSATATGGRIGWNSHPALGPHRITVVGEQGSETFDAWEPRLEISNEQVRPELPKMHPQDPMGMWRSTQRLSGVARKTAWQPLFDETRWYLDDVSAFLDCLDEKRKPEIGARAAVGSVEVLMAAYRSASTGRPERLDG